MTSGDILIIGAGVIGCATATVLADGGSRIFGVDPDERAATRFPGTLLDPGECARDWTAIVVCVPTPTIEGQMDEAPLRDALAFTAGLPVVAGRAPLGVVRSTLVPGTMDRLVFPALAANSARPALRACHWPSFARERSAVADERAPRQTVVGRVTGDAAAESVMDRLLCHIGMPLTFVEPVEAELIKHGANLFNALKISYFNALADWAAERSANAQVVANAVATVAEAAWNPLYGTKVGPAFGGACLPKDLEALSTRLAADSSSHLELLRAIAAINADSRRTAPPAESA